MKSNSVYFRAEEARTLAQYLYTLTQLGAAYMVEESGRGGWYVTVTGF